MQNRMHQSLDFRAALLAERTRLVSGREDEWEVLTAPGSLAVDDQAPLLHEQFVAISQRLINHRKLKLIDAALERLDRGDFGMCEECGEGIPLKRLTILPWAAYCVPCQEQLDQEKFFEEPQFLLAA